MKKVLVLSVMVLAFNLTNAQENKIETVIFVDGVECKTVEYASDEGSIIDYYSDKTLVHTTKVKDSVTITGSIENYNLYGKYVAFNISITNNTNESFNFIPSKHIKAVNSDGKKTKRFLTWEQYNEIVERRQNGNAFFTALAGGLASIGDGTVSSTTHGRVGGTSYSSTTVMYSPALAESQRRQRSDDMSRFVQNQSNLYMTARNNYMKANTILPKSTVTGHILIPLKGLSKKNYGTNIVIEVNGSKFYWNK